MWGSLVAREGAFPSCLVHSVHQSGECKAVSDIRRKFAGHPGPHQRGRRARACTISTGPTRLANSVNNQGNVRQAQTQKHVAAPKQGHAGQLLLRRLPPNCALHAYSVDHTLQPVAIAQPLP